MTHEQMKDPIKFRREMARFQIRSAREKRAAGRGDRAEVALRLYRLWRNGGAYAGQ